ncbi:MAG: prepilin peptidase [Patescibacteria group bacterium]|nr:prepilin peptidase [Patescibacteria group bacterium]
MSFMIAFFIMSSFSLGLVFGSFFNVIVYRFADDELNWKKGRSSCESCGTKIHWFDNIPLLSFILLKGRCRRCQERIALFHPLIEFLTGLIFASVAYWQICINFNVFSFLFWLFVIAVTWLIFLFDWFYLIIPDELVIVLAICGLTKNLITYSFGQLSPFQLYSTFAVALITTGLFWFLRWVTKKKGMGLGDVKLVGPLVLLMGFPESLVGVVLAFMIGAFFGIILVVLKQKKIKQKIAFGPFLIIGFWQALLIGKSVWEAYWQLII